MPVTINRKKTVRVWHGFTRAKGQYYVPNRTNVFFGNNRKPRKTRRKLRFIVVGATGIEPVTPAV